MSTPDIPIPPSSSFLCALEIDPDSTILRWGKGAENTFGYTPGEITGKSVAELYRPLEKSLGLFRKAISHCLSRGEAWSEGWWRKKNGSVVLCNALLLLNRTHDGHPRSITQILEPIPTIDPANPSLVDCPADWFMVEHRSLSRRSPLLENLGASIAGGYFVVDDSGNFMFGNREAQRLKPASPLAPNDSISAAYGFFGADRHTPMPDEELCILQALGGIKTSPQELYYDNGNFSGWIEMSSVPLVDENKHHYGALVTFSTIDKMKRDEELLTVFWQAINQSNHSVVIADYRQKGIPLIYVNRTFEEITGYAASEVIGKNCRFLQGQERNQKAREIIRHAVKNGERCRVILRNFRKDGSAFINQLTLSPLKNSDGEITHYLGFQNDITHLVSGKEHLHKLLAEANC